MNAPGSRETPPTALARLVSLLRHPATRGLDLDSAAATEAHRRVLQSKPTLRRLYERYYSDIIAEVRKAPAGPALEVGAGGGFLRELWPEVLTLDLRPGADVNVRADAMELPFRGASLCCVAALNVVHHLERPERFFEECERVLRVGGRVALIEPFVSPLSTFVYRRLHHEGFEPTRRRWTQPEGGPMSAADAALSWVMLVRDRRRFERRFPALEILDVRPHTALTYLATGGLSYRDLLPAPLFAALARCEDALPPCLMARLGSMMTVVLLKRG